MKVDVERRHQTLSISRDALMKREREKQETLVKMIQQLASLVCFVVIIFNQNGLANAAVCPVPAGCPPEYRLDSYQVYLNGVITSLPVDDGCERVRLILERLNSRGAPSGQVRASLFWDNTNDLDGEVHPYHARTSGDVNGQSPYSSTPIEYTVFSNGEFLAGSTITFKAFLFVNRNGVNPTTAYILIESYGRRQLLKADLNASASTSYFDFIV